MLQAMLFVKSGLVAKYSCIAKELRHTLMTVALHQHESDCGFTGLIAELYLQAEFKLEVMEDGPVDGFAGFFDVQFKGSPENPTDVEVLLTTGTPLRHNMCQSAVKMSFCIPFKLANLDRLVTLFHRVSLSDNAMVYYH